MVENENNVDNDSMMFVTEMYEEYVDVERKDRADAAAAAAVVVVVVDDDDDEGELLVDIDEDYAVVVVVVVVAVDDDDDDEQTIEYVVEVGNEMLLYVDVVIN